VSMGTNGARHVLSMVDELGKVLALELYTAAQALDLRLDMINAARDLARRGGVQALLRTVPGVPEGEPRPPAFVAEGEEQRHELAQAEPFHRGRRVAAAHAAIRRRIPFLDRDRALDADVAAAVELVADGTLLEAIGR